MLVIEPCLRRITYVSLKVINSIQSSLSTAANFGLEGTLAVCVCVCVCVTVWGREFNFNFQRRIKTIELNSKTSQEDIIIYLPVKHLSYHNSSTVKEASDIATRESTPTN